MCGSLALIPLETRTFVGARSDQAEHVERVHFFSCGACKQLIDMRDLDAVFHHEVAGHSPLPRSRECRLATIEDQLRGLLSRGDGAGLLA